MLNGKLLFPLLLMRLHLKTLIEEDCGAGECLSRAGRCRRCPLSGPGRAEPGGAARVKAPPPPAGYSSQGAGRGPTFTLSFNSFCVLRPGSPSEKL